LWWIELCASGEGRSSAAPLQGKCVSLTGGTTRPASEGGPYKGTKTRQLPTVLGDFWGSGGEFELELLGTENRVRGGEFHRAWLFLGANPDGAGAAD
jgi:hypothetical protein